MLEILNTDSLIALSPLLVYLVLFGICILEGMPVVGSIVAGGTITIAAGSLAHLGIIDPIFTLIIASIGSFIGDIFGFLLLRKYGSKVPYLRRLVNSVTEHKGRLSDLFDRQYFMITVITKLVPIVRSAPSLIAAARNVPVGGYLLASILASTLWAVSGVAVGYGLSTFINEKYIFVGIIGFVIISTLIAVYKMVINKKKYDI